MQNSGKQPLVSVVAGTATISVKLREIAQGVRPVTFSHVTEPAQPLLVAAIAAKMDCTVWVICANVRSQESLYESLLNWAPDAVFLPEAEFAAVEDILPDPEIAAERLAVLTEINRNKRSRIVVVTRAGIEQAAPEPAALKSAVRSLRQGVTKTLGRLIETLVEAGYERVAQVTARGQFAVRGGILDLYSWQAQSPVRAEFFDDDIESLR
ncbi:MAG: transcription-repair coupling factor, partial [Chthoniobacterales bacterium]